MLTKRHLIFNIIIIIIPWISLIIVGKRNLKRFASAGVFIVIVDIIDHLIAKKRKWWRFYSKSDSFFLNELPFVIGLYFPVSIWMLTLSYENFKKYIKLNAIGDGLFAFVLLPLLKKWKIVRLYKITNIQFFLFIFIKAFLLYFVQYTIENSSKWFYKIASIR